MNKNIKEKESLQERVLEFGQLCAKVFNNGIEVLIGTNGLIASKLPDSNEYIRRYSPTDKNINSICGANEWIATTIYGQILYSSDSITWEIIFSDRTFNFVGVAGIDDDYIAISNNGKIVRLNVDTLHYSIYHSHLRLKSIEISRIANKPFFVITERDGRKIKINK